MITIELWQDNTLKNIIVYLIYARVFTPIYSQDNYILIALLVYNCTQTYLACAGIRLICNRCFFAPFDYNYTRVNGLLARWCIYLTHILLYFTQIALKRMRLHILTGLAGLRAPFLALFWNSLVTIEPKVLIGILFLLLHLLKVWYWSLLSLLEINSRHNCGKIHNKEYI